MEETILIAEDDRTSHMLLRRVLERAGFDVRSAMDGNVALEILSEEEGPMLGILDWMMPEMDGLDVVERVRALDRKSPPYLIMLTTRDAKDDIIHGLEAGANDYVTKPFHREELLARVRVGVRVIELQRGLARKIAELEDALAHIKTLQGILPICMYCHKIRDDHEAWQRLESYLLRHTDVELSHGICPDCLKERHPSIYQQKYGDTAVVQPNSSSSPSKR